MPLILHDLRGRPDIQVFDPDDCPRWDGQPFYVRLPPLGSRISLEMIGRTSIEDVKGFVLPGFVGPPDIERFGAMLAVAEAEHDLPDGSLSILAIADNPAGILALPSLRPTPRLAAIACDPATLATTLGCDSTAPAVVSARALTILAASACGIGAILVADAVSPDACREALSEGFSAVLAKGDRE